MPSSLTSKHAGGDTAPLLCSVHLGAVGISTESRSELLSVLLGNIKGVCDDSTASRNLQCRQTIQTRDVITFFVAVDSAGKANE